MDIVGRAALGITSLYRYFARRNALLTLIDPHELERGSSALCASPGEGVESSAFAATISAAEKKTARRVIGVLLSGWP